MHGNDVIELRQGIVFDGNNRPIVAGVVHENIDLAEFCARLHDNTRAIRFKRQIGERIVRACATP